MSLQYSQSFKDEMSHSLDRYLISIRNLKNDINSKVGLLEENKAARDMQRKGLLLREMKLILSKLENDDTKSIKDFKSDSFDVLMALGRLEDEVHAAFGSLEKEPEGSRRWRTEVGALQRKLVNHEKFVKSLNLSVGSLPSGALSASIMDKASDAIYLENSSFSPKTFSLYLTEKFQGNEPSDSEHAPNYYEVQIHSMHEDLGFPDFLLKRLHFTVSSPLQGSNVPQTLEDCSVWDKISQNKARVFEDEKLVKIWIKRPKNMTYAVSVKLFNSNISRSPQVQQFLSECTSVISQNLTLASSTVNANDTGIEMFDRDASMLIDAGITNAVNNKAIMNELELDESDLKSLDMTTRRKLMMLAKNPNLIINQLPPGSPKYHPIRRAPGETNVHVHHVSQARSSVPLPPGPPISSSLERFTDTSPFRPSTGTGQISTMRPTSASQLSEALEEVTVPLDDPEDKMDVPETHNDFSVVDPTKRSSVSIEDAQRSLSGEESGSEQSLMQDRRLSVSFASHAQVVSVLATPQVKAGGQRFVVADAETKEQDGEAGTQSFRKKVQQVSAALSLEEDSDNCPKTVSRSQIIGMVSDNSGSTYNEEDDECDKTVPLPDEDESNEEIGRLAVEENEGGVEENLGIRDSGTSSTDMSCDDPNWKQGDFVPSTVLSKPTFLNTSEWSEINSTVGELDNFRRQNFQLTGHFSSIPASHSRKVLLHPHDVAYLPSLKQFLVTETFHDRVGVYDENFDFKFWLQHPKRYQRFHRPNSVLNLSNGNVLILEKKGIQFYDHKMNWFQFKAGHYSGLTEGPNDNVYTLSWFKEETSRCHVRQLSLTETGKYVWRGSIKLTLMSRDPKCAESNPRFLTFSNGLLVITDLGQNRFYTARVDCGDQNVFGYFGHNPGQIARPTGVIMDDKDNILIIDKDNKRLVVYSDKGEFLRVMDVPDLELPRNLQTIRKINNDYYICDRGSKDSVGGIYKLSLCN